MLILLLAVLFVIVLALLGTYLWVQRMLRIIYTPPVDYPNPKACLPEQQVLVCAGDSITHGNVSYNWVNVLREQLPNKIQVFNAGINSDLSDSLLNRIDDIIAVKPSLVSILIGTNDINATLSKSALKRYYEQKKIPIGTLPSIKSYQNNLTTIVRTLKSKTSAQIALVSLPVIGEDLNSLANQKVDEYSAVIKQIATAEQCSYLPFREQMHEFLRANPQPIRYSYAQTLSLMYKCIWGHFVLHKNWDELSQKNGFQLVTDNLHLNSVAGAMLTKCVLSFVKKHENS